MPHTSFKGTVSRDFASGFFHESSFPKPPENYIRVVSNFLKFAEILASQGAPPVPTTPAANNWINIRLLAPYSELEEKNVSM
jgi:hypothetical protein